MDRLVVVEFGNYLAGPLLGAFFAKFGARVHAIRRPADADRRARLERHRMGRLVDELARGKTVHVARLPSDADRVLALVDDAALVVENFGQDAMRRMGVDAATCFARNPRLVYVSLPGFAPDDDEFKSVFAAYDSILMASAGVFNNMGLNRTLRGIEASYSGLPLPSVYGAMFGFLAATAALHAKRGGELITVPLASALAEAMVHNSIDFGRARCYINQRHRRLLDGAYPIDRETLRTLFDPFFKLYRCADGRQFYLVCPAHARHQRRALDLLGICDEVLEIVSFKQAYDNDGSCGLGCGYLSTEQNDRVRPAFERAFATRTAAEWEAAFGAAGVPGIALRDVGEWRTDPHAVASGLCRDGDVSNLGWFADGRPLAPEERAVPRPRGPHCLSGVRVVDLSNVIAGPTIGTMLARLGADVCKIDPPCPTYAPDISVFYGLATNVGKRSLLLDVYSPDGRAVLLRLLRTADVLIVNCTHSCLRRMRLTRDDLRAVNPRLVLAHFDAWSGPRERGALADFNGYDDCVQAAIGIMTRFGGGVDTAEEHAHIGTIDVIAGVAGAGVVVAALLERDVAGVVHTARTSLAAVGQLVQFPFMFGDDASPRRYRTGEACVGEHALLRCYRAADGWFLLAASFDPADEDAARRTARAAPARLPLDDDSFRAHEVEALCARLNRAGVAAHPLRDMHDVRRRHLASAPRPGSTIATGATFQFWRHDDHPIGSLEIAAPTAMRMRGLRVDLGHAPAYGQHTRDELRRVCDRDEAARLARDGVVAHRWSRTYIPFVSPCHRCGLQGRKKYVLACGHELCLACSLFPSSRPECPVCHAAHELRGLRGKVDDVRRRYAAWRRGGRRGAKNAEYAHRPYAATPLPSSRSCPAALSAAA